MIVTTARGVDSSINLAQVATEAQETELKQDITAFFRPNLLASHGSSCVNPDRRAFGCLFLWICPAILPTCPGWFYLTQPRVT